MIRVNGAPWGFSMGQSVCKNFFHVSKVVEGSASSSAGLQAGVYVMAIEGESIKGWEMLAVLQRIRAVTSNRLTLELRNFGINGGSGDCGVGDDGVGTKVSFTELHKAARRTQYEKDTKRKIGKQPVDWFDLYGLVKSEGSCYRWSLRVVFK